ncbi:hypothetical protein [Cypionkella sp.]|uniref:hypothetical protein n=1 Tax=Cypionkella sp. TaxID=2811411 RepID=UPI002ABA4D96|nr:hypothetical protein [Cypionkella sp.]MDZ4394212.1 hypothetical protein [Cypionkella sp.]
MKRPLDFWSDEAGAVTVDWVVLTAGVVLFATAIGAMLNGGGDSSIANHMRQVIVNAVDGVGAEGE